MNRSLFCTLIAFATLAGTGCASGGGGGGGMGRSISSTDLGSQLDSFIEEARLKVWSKYAIPVYRNQRQFRAIVVESEWMPRQPEPAEAATGVLAARNQIILRGRRIREDASGEGVFRFAWELHNEVRTDIVSSWHPAPMSREVIALYSRALGEMEMEVRTGIRR